MYLYLGVFGPWVLLGGYVLNHTRHLQVHTDLFVESWVQLVRVPHQVNVVHRHNVHVREQLLEAHKLPVPATRSSVETPWVRRTHPPINVWRT